MFGEISGSDFLLIASTALCHAASQAVPANDALCGACTASDPNGLLVRVVANHARGRYDEQSSELLAEDVALGPAHVPTPSLLPLRAINARHRRSACPTSCSQRTCTTKSTPEFFSFANCPLSFVGDARRK